MRGIEAIEASNHALSVLIRQRRLRVLNSQTNKELEAARRGEVDLNHDLAPKTEEQLNGHSSADGILHFSATVGQILASHAATQGEPTISKRLEDLRLLTERRELLTSNVEQRRILSMVKEGQIKLEDWRSLFHWYAQSEMFKNVIKSNNGNSPISLNGKKHRKLRSDFGGRVFEDIAFIYAAVKFAKYIVLSPKETLDVFKGIYPGSRIVHPSIFQTTISGVSVPDGLIVDPRTGEVLKILEFSLDRKVNRFAGKIRTILQGRERLNKEFGGGTFLFVIPQTFPVPQSIKDNGALVSSYQVPFSHRNFASFVHRHLPRSAANKGKQ